MAVTAALRQTACYLPLIFEIMEQDELLPQAIEIAKNEGKIRTTILQLKLKLGYNRATRLMIAMEEMGLLGGKIGEYWFDREFVG